MLFKVRAHVVVFETGGDKQAGRESERDPFDICVYL